MFESFTGRSIKVIMLAQGESRRLGRSFVCTEHILLGILSDEARVAALGILSDEARVAALGILSDEASVAALGILSDENRVAALGILSDEASVAALGILSDEASVAGKVLKSMGVTLEHARIEVEKITGRGSDFVAVDIPAVDVIPFSPKACRALDLAEEESQQLGHNYIGAEHLLLGTIRIEDGIALQVLANLGVDATEIRGLVVRMLGENTEG
jgi:Clp amino terminal domain, pathogenicity island component